jgi:hypothetical protein
VQVLDHCLSKVGAAALRVQIFIPQNKFAPMLFGPLRCNPECARVADMKQASGRRGESAAVDFRIRAI